MTKKDITTVAKLLSKKKNIVIVTHKNPDGDAMGSSLGLYNFLKKKNHNAVVVTPNSYPDFLAWLPGNNNVIHFETRGEEAQKHISKVEIIFCLDFNAFRRVEELGALIQKSSALKILIDHHPQPEKEFDYLLHDVKACSTAELVYEFIVMVNEKKKIDRNIANCLYTGIMTDTNNFTIPTTTQKTHHIVSELIKFGAQNTLAHNHVYDTYTEGRLRLLGYALSEKMKVFPEFHCAYIALSKEELEQFNFRQGDTEGLVNYPLSIDGIIFSAFFMERDGMVKASFRSKGKFDVNKFARANYDGGGHVNAAGGNHYSSLETAINKFVSLLPSFKNELDKS